MKYEFRFMLKIFLLILAVPILASAEEDQIVHYSSNLNENIYYAAQYYEDTANNTDSKTILNQLQKFIPLPSANIALTLKDHSTWVRVKFDNPTNEVKKIYLAFSPSYMGVINIYKKNKALNLSTVTGTLTPSEFRSVSSDLSTDVELDSGLNEFFIEIKSVGSGIAIKALSEEQFNKNRSLNEIIFFLVIGALGILSFYHLFIYITSRDLVYLYYVLYSVMMIFTLFTLTGFNRYIFPTHIMGFPIGYLGSLFFANAVFIAVANLTIELLGLKRNKSRLKYAFWGLIILSTLSIIYLVSYQNYLSIPITRVLGLYFVVISLMAGIVESMKGNKTAILYLISWTPILLGTVSVVLVLSGVLNASLFTDWVLAFGCVIESLFLAMAIGNRLDRATKEKIVEQGLRIKAYEQLQENFIKLQKRDEVIKSFVSPTILLELAQRKEPLTYQPKYLQKAILFADLRGYTTLTEKISPNESYELLNDFFDAMNSSVFENNGEVDKLIGDAVMATFWDADSCMRAVIEFRNKLNEINRKKVELGKVPIRVGCGLAYGKVLSANFGTLQKLDRTIVGDIVNLASRLEGLNKVYHTDIICSEDFFRQLSPVECYRILDYVAVKGKTEKVYIYELFEHSSDRVKDFKLKTKDDFKKILELKLHGSRDEACIVVDKYLSHCPEHTYLDNEILDPTLKALKESIMSNNTTDNLLLKREVG